MTPDAFLALARTTIIKSGAIQNSKSYGAPEMVGLFAETTYKGEMPDGKACDIVNLGQRATDGKFKAYVCDFEANQINYQVLGKAAEFCFTITMNGCTFGIGAPTVDGSVLVTHGNMGGQAAPQLEMGQFMHTGGVNTTFVQPGDYLKYDGGNSGRANITTFGLRDGNKWKFYYQRYATLGNQRMRHLGVTEVSTNSISG